MNQHQDFDYARGLATVAMGVFAFYGKVLTRSGFGINEVGAGRIAFNLAVMGGILYLLAGSGMLSPFFIGFAVIFAVAALYHRLRLGRFGFDYPDSFGIFHLARLFPGMHGFPWTGYTWLEPLLVAGIGWLLLLVDRPLGGFLIVIALAMKAEMGAYYKAEKDFRIKLKRGEAKGQYISRVL